MRFKSLFFVAIFAIAGTSGSALADDAFVTLNGLTVAPMTSVELDEVVGAKDYIKNNKADSRSPLWSEDLAIGEAADGNEQGLGAAYAESRGSTPIDWNQDPF